MRAIGVVTVARSDYGIYRPLLRAIEADPDLELCLFVSGMHLSPEFGLTVRGIEEDGFPIAERVEMLLSSDAPEGIAKSMGIGTMGFAQAFARSRPDILVVLGDRFEMHAAAVAALPFRIPVAHMHGGELTQGAIDDALRHSITKLSHLHFVATEEYARRVIQLGEEPWRVTVSGALSIDNVKQTALLSSREMEDRYGIRLDPAPLLVTYHPVTLEYEQTEQQIVELLGALDDAGLPVVFTLPNADTGNSIIRRRIIEWSRGRSDAWVRDNLGTWAYFGLMKSAAAMVGNSSSGIIEAPSFALPVVNIGPRQEGRIRAGNVIDVSCSRYQIIKGIDKALSTAFRARLSDCDNPYGDGDAAQRVIRVLRSVEIGNRLAKRRFHDLKTEASRPFEEG